MQLGLIGFPLEHSLSPRIHQAALKYAGIAGGYDPFPVQPGDTQALKALLERVRSGEIDGLNVTIPHKQTVISFVDELTSQARIIGAVNTISRREDGTLVGDSTDAPGFLADLQRSFPRRPWELMNCKLALVLGAGGAARAVIAALLSAGWQVRVAARRPEQAGALIADFPQDAQNLAAIPLQPEALCAQCERLTLIVNTTPVGMFPQVEACPWPQDLDLPPQASVYDVIYNPRASLLVRRAQAAGLPATGGLGMLLEQAALSFRIWTGINVPRPVWAAAVEDR